MCYRSILSILVPAIFLSFAVEGFGQNGNSNTLSISPKKVQREKDNEKDAGKPTYTWLTPLQEQIEVKDEQLKVEVVVESPGPLERGDVALYLNGQRISDKNGKVLARPSTKNKFIFQWWVDMVEGINELEVRTGRSSRSQPKVVRNVDGIVEEIVRGTAAGENGIFWQTPTWSSEPIVQEKRELSISVIINSSVELKKPDVYCVLHNILIQEPSDYARLKFLGDGQYEFTETIQLDQEGLTPVTVKVKKDDLVAMESEPLHINFTPNRVNIHLLAIGTQTNLRYTMDDARDVAAYFFRQQDSRLFNEVDTSVIIGRQATAAAISRSVELMESKFTRGEIGPKDVIILYLSSHGFLDNNMQLRIQGDDFDQDAWRSTSVSYQQDIMNVLNNIPCKKIIFIDACYSGGSRGDEQGVDDRIREINGKLEGITSIVSSAGDEASYEDEAWQNGAFTEAILQALGGAADKDNNQIVTINELMEYVSATVPVMVAEQKGKTQHPKLLRNDLGDLAIFDLLSSPNE